MTSFILLLVVGVMIVVRRSQCVDSRGQTFLALVRYRAVVYMDSLMDVLSIYPLPQSRHLSQHGNPEIRGGGNTPW